jgi:DNA-binding transcriptional ArsR family regulator
MSERGVRVVFSPETPRRAPSVKRPTTGAGDQNHSHIATNERTSTAGRRARTGQHETSRLKSDLPIHLRKRLPAEDRLKRISMLFAILADQQRLKILLTLKAANELCVCEVARLLGVSVSVASHHLRRLRDLEILEDRSDGKLVYYSLRQTLVADLALTALTGCR